MRHLRTKSTILAAASVLALGAASPALAGDKAMMDYSSHSTVEKAGDELAMTDSSISAQALLRGTVRSGSSDLHGEITDIVLDENGDAAYVIFAMSDAAAATAEKSFASFDQVMVEPAAGARDARVFLDMATDDTGAPVTVEVTEAEASERLVSRILDSTVQFHTGGEARISDVLLTRDGRADVAIVEAGDADTPESFAVPFSSLTPGPEGFYHVDEAVTPDVLLFIG